MPTGLRNPAVIGRIVAAMAASEANWAGSLPRQRTLAIANIVVAELRAIGVTPPAVQVATFPGLAGQFDFGPWTLQVDMGMAIGRVGQTQDEMIAKIAELGDTVTHEARHCEQWFRMGRLLASQRRARGLFVDGREICNRLGIDNRAVGDAAAGAGVMTNAERLEAEEWYESVYGGGSGFREQTFALELNATGRATGNAWQTGAYARYQRGLAEEEDAFGIGTAVQRQYLQPHPGVNAPQMTRHAPVRRGVTTY
ncbi:MAG: hypothetical protein AAF250_11035 [Pseudomonadota bacterium]